MKEAIETLTTFELFKGRDPSQFSIEQLGGLTNKNFMVSAHWKLKDQKLEMNFLIN